MLVRALRRVHVLPVFVVTLAVALAVAGQIRSQPFDPTISVVAVGPPQTSFGIELDDHDREFVLTAIDECAVQLGFRRARISMNERGGGPKFVYRWYVIDGGPLITFTTLGGGGRNTIDAYFYDREGASESMKSASRLAARFRQLLPATIRVSEIPDLNHRTVKIPHYP